MNTFLSHALTFALLATAAGSTQAQSFKGSGSEATTLFALGQGLAVFETEHRGPGAFVIKLLDAEGALVGEIANGSGVFGGSKALKIEAAGRYLLDVQATGPWSVRLRRNEPEALAAIDSLVVQAEANGRADGSRPGTLGWFTRGLVGGLILGPIGTAVAANRAADSALPSAQAAANALPLGQPGYTAAYRQGYLDRLGSRRQRSAVIGGVFGMSALAIVLLQAFDLVGSSEGSEPGGDDPPAIVVPIFRWSR